MKFASPLFLLLLLLVPVAAWMGWPSRGPARKREFLSLALRLIIIVCLVFSLADLEDLQGGDDLAVVFLVDVSDSMPQEAVNAEVEYVRAALEEMKSDDLAAIVLFGAGALVERSLSTSRELSSITSVPVTNQTDIAEAIQLGLALFQPGYAKRMVILSDGAETSGDALEAAKFAVASDVQIIVVPFVNQRSEETLITDVDVPAHIRPGEEFDLNLTVQASGPTTATVRILRGDQVLYEQTHNLRRGQQTLTLPLTAGQPGFVGYQVQITPQTDSFYQNNLIYAFSQVEGPPRILMAVSPSGETLPGGETRPDEYSHLVQTLESAGFQVDLIPPTRIPSDLPALAQYDSVVMVDVPARTLGNNQMENIQAYVHDLGGGLVVVGGPTSYGVGGYFRTPLEAALPVDMEIKDEQRRPSLGIVFIIDHSGSMSDSSGGVEKLELAKEAAARSIELLFPTDRVGVIAFDDVASWVVPMTELSDPSQVTSAIGSIQSGGGTDILAGLQAMAEILPNDPAKVKHVILLTDGGADPTGIPELIQKLYEEDGITLSTVGIGNDAAPFLEDLATIGAGRYHFTNDASSIPSIFTEETSLATRAYIVEEPFSPTLVNSSPILNGIHEVPRLLGYVATSPKDLAQVILQSDKKDPILATWQYGLGRSVAFTSDATGRWAKDWLNWSSFPTFWVQVVRYTIGNSSTTTLQMNIQAEGEQARITLDARNPGGEFINGYQVQANIVAPGDTSQLVTLQQTAPGQYEASFRPTSQGVYLLHFSGTSNTAQRLTSFAKTLGWTLSYSPEYQRLNSDPDLLLRLAAATGGEVTSSNPADIFAHNLRATRASHDLWPLLIILSALLLPIDIASRRLIITQQDLVHAQARIMEKIGKYRVSSSSTQRSLQMQTLIDVKNRISQNMRSAPTSQYPQTEATPPALETDETVHPHKEPEDLPKPSEPQVLESDRSTTTSLLAYKKAKRKKNN